MTKIMSNNGKIIFLVGAPQTGKTTEVKRLIKDIDPNSIGAVDYNNEYNCAFKTLDFEELIRLGLRTKNKTLIFEEATSYCTTNNILEFKKLLSRSMGHLKHNVLLCFHNLNRIPADLLPYINELYYTKTIEKNKVYHPLDRVKKEYTRYPRSVFYN